MFDQIVISTCFETQRIGFCCSAHQQNTPTYDLNSVIGRCHHPEYTSDLGKFLTASQGHSVA